MQMAIRPNHRRRSWGRALVCLAALAAFAGIAHPGQNSQPGWPVHDSMPAPPSNDPPDANARMQMQQQQQQKNHFEQANAERKRQIEDDAARLLQLATELKAEVDKTDKDTLSLNVIRKAETIEKLAKGVKEKMKLTMGAS